MIKWQYITLEKNINENKRKITILPVSSLRYILSSQSFDGGSRHSFFVFHSRLYSSNQVMTRRSHLPMLCPLGMFISDHADYNVPEV